MSAWEEIAVKKKRRKSKSKKEKHDRQWVVHVVKTGNKGELAKFTKNSWKVSILSFH